MSVVRVSESTLPTRWGTFCVVAYRDHVGHEHLALVVGTECGHAGRFEGDDPVLVRVHSECLTGDTFGSQRCDCQQQLHDALERVQDTGAGVVLYLRGHEGRGIGLAAKISAYQLQDRGLDTYDANLELGLPVDARSFDVAADMLRDLGIESVRLITNNPEKVGSLERAGLHVVERVPALSTPTEHNANYLRTKRERMGHQLDDLPAPTAR
jgi:3,4-dihydroxy 2-butanone 4-phosphate synthase/GTP cyclohydrolase II